MKNYAVIDEVGNILNVILWDGESEWSPDEDTKVIECSEGECQIGGKYKDGVFSPPPAAEITKEESVNQAQIFKVSLLSEANSYTQPWQTQLMLGIISDADKASLTIWMKYYQQVQNIDTSKAPDITWPEKPTN